MKKNAKKKMEPGPFYTDAKGNRRDDGLHDAMLNNVEADVAFREGAVQSAIKSGVPEALARKIYGVPARKMERHS